MHVLDDAGDLSPRAQAFLQRTGSRATGEKPRLPSDYLRVPDRTGRLVSPPRELVVRREWFAARFGGLRYNLRRSVFIGGDRHETVRQWRYDLLDRVRPEHSGWSFEWYGEHVSSPVFYLVHTDGRFGVSAGGPFLDVSPSINHLIDSHALMDEVADWEPVPASSLEPWVPYSDADARLQELTAGLVLVAEASGPCEQWWYSDERVVRVCRKWTDEQPRPTSVMVWIRNA